MKHFKAGSSAHYPNPHLCLWVGCQVPRHLSHTDTERNPFDLWHFQINQEINRRNYNSGGHYENNTEIIGAQRTCWRVCISQTLSCAAKPIWWKLMRGYWGRDVIAKTWLFFPYLLRECYLRISNRSSLHLRMRVWLWEDSSETTVCS